VTIILSHAVSGIAFMDKIPLHLALKLIANNTASIAHNDKRNVIKNVMLKVPSASQRRPYFYTSICLYFVNTK
jgi:hypothetical protein